MSAKHTTIWEDSGFVGVRCNGLDVDLMLDVESPEPRACPACHAKLILKWKVSIEEVGGEKQ